MSLLFPELKMSGEFFEQRREVEILIKQAQKKPIIVPFIEAITSVPQPMPRSA